MSASADKIITILAAVSTPALGLLVDQHVITALTSLDIGSIIAAAVASYHGGKAVGQRAANAVAPLTAAVPTQTTSKPDPYVSGV